MTSNAGEAQIRNPAEVTDTVGVQVSGQSVPGSVKLRTWSQHEHIDAD